MKKIISFILSSLLFSSLSLALAQESMTVATVNIYNATSTQISTTTFSVAFQIFNRVGIQSNIRYGLELVKASSNEVVDRKLSNEALTLGEKDFKDLKMNYSIPGFVANGDYKIMIVVENQNALPLAYMPAGFPEKIISVKTNYANGLLSLNNCQIYVNGQTNKPYTLLQGVDILSNEKLSANCDIQNNSFQDFNDLKIKMITHKRNPFGDIVNHSMTLVSFPLLANSLENINFDLSTVSSPQAYDIDTFLINDQGEKVSPSIRLHYVMSGASATIQNTYLDKADYKKGDKANLKLFWSPSADSFPDSRFGASSLKYNLLVNLYDQNKNLCGTFSSALKSQTDFASQDVKVSINKDCPQSVATVSILNAETNQVLDSTQINLANPVENINIDSTVKNISGQTIQKSISSQKSLNYINLVAIIFVLFILGYGILKLKGEHFIKK